MAQLHERYDDDDGDLGVDLPEYGVNDAETRRCGMRPYLHVSQVHFWGDMNVQLN